MTGAIAGGNVKHAVAGDGRGIDVGAGTGGRPLQLPKDFAVGWIVGANRVTACSDNFGAELISPDERACPIRSLVAGDPPKILARLLVEGGQEGLLVVVAKDEKAVAVQGR